jgi:hypothetical protein
VPEGKCIYLGAMGWALKSPGFCVCEGVSVSNTSVLPSVP